MFAYPLKGAVRDGLVTQGPDDNAVTERLEEQACDAVRDAVREALVAAGSKPLFATIDRTKEFSFNAQTILQVANRLAEMIAGHGSDTGFPWSDEWITKLAEKVKELCHRMFLSEIFTALMQGRSGPASRLNDIPTMPIHGDFLAALGSTFSEIIVPAMETRSRFAETGAI